MGVLRAMIHMNGWRVPAGLVCSCMWVRVTVKAGPSNAASCCGEERVTGNSRPTSTPDDGGGPVIRKTPGPPPNPLIHLSL
jgi:hypothetical protein